jgi:putative dimethyl sulfoxide reductase chaperone
MSIENAIRRAQVYGFLVDALLYPHENWTEDARLVERIVRSLGWLTVQLKLPAIYLADLQAAHRHTFGLAGSLCYETEYGLPHEYRQSQEMADIAGFYRAFGFNLGGAAQGNAARGSAAQGSVVRERPDHIAVELEFMHLLALKEAHALEIGIPEQVEICQDAQAKFLSDHLARWIELFAQAVAHNAPDTLYAPLARFAADFVQADADRLGATFEKPNFTEVQHTPFDPDFSCATCELAGAGEQNFVRTSSIRQE